MGAEFNSNLVKNLPDAYKKTSTSNNFKILEIARLSCSDLRANLQEISDILDIANAQGKTLDLYGERVGQARGVTTDDKYFVLIKAKIMRNLSNGSYQSVVNALCETLNCEPSQVVLVDGEDARTVTITTLPLDVINNAGFTTSQVTAIIKSLLPIGVKLSSFLYEGTFEFGTNEDDTDNEKGFANADGTIGGYLGATSSDTSDIILPI